MIVTTGEAEENRKLFAEHGVGCPVLLQAPGTGGAGGEVASQYRCHGTPMGYLIDEQGRIASDQAVGSQALLALLRALPAPGAANGTQTLGGKRTIAESKLQRNGLAAGTRAPNFTLPRLDGGELSPAAPQQATGAGPARRELRRLLHDRRAADGTAAAYGAAAGRRRPFLRWRE